MKGELTSPFRSWGLGQREGSPMVIERPHVQWHIKGSMPAVCHESTYMKNAALPHLEFSA